MNKESFPLASERSASQRYVFFLMEPPSTIKRHGDRTDLFPENYFNWTMTYRASSDIQVPFFSVEKLPQRMTDEDFDAIRLVVLGKDKQVAWFNSHCRTPSGREVYADQLRKHVEVDIFGRCGAKECSKRNATECNRQLSNDYRFYLAFENAVCDEYVTEKFAKAKQLIVPIVLRASDYEHLLPPGSFIAADQYKSPQRLAAHLNRLRSNLTEYMRYFEWRRDYQIRSLDAIGDFEANPAQRSCEGFCTLCEWLHDERKPRQSWLNVHHWWFSAPCVDKFATSLARRRGGLAKKDQP